MRTRLLTILMMLLMSIGVVAYSQDVSSTDATTQDADSLGPQPQVVQLPNEAIRIRVIDNDQSLATERAAREEAKQNLSLLAEANRIADEALKLGQANLTVSIIALVMSLLGTFALLYTIYLNRRSTIAAEKAVESQESLAHAQSRAYVFPYSSSAFRVAIPDAREAGEVEPFRIFINGKVRNTGSTPASKIRTSTVLQVGTLEEIMLLELGEPQSSSTLGPNSELTQSAVLSRPLTNSDIETFVSQGKTLWVRGFIEYEDVYEKKWRFDFISYIKNFEAFINSDANIGFTSHTDGTSFYRVV